MGSIAGTYRCYRHNVGGAKDDVCAGASLVLREDGTYLLAPDRGTYSVKDGKVSLSGAKALGPGSLRGDRIVFEYVEKGLMHRVTYLRQVEGAATAVRVVVAIELGTAKADGINTASLIPQGASLGLERFDSLAWADGPHRVECSFRNVPIGKIYTLYAGTEREMKPFGAVDLRHASGTVRLTVTAPSSGASTRESPVQTR